MADGRNIAANLARLRLDRRMTQEELAANAGLSRLSLGKIERGTVVPRAQTLTNLAEALGVPVSELVLPVRILEPRAISCPGTTACPAADSGESFELARRLRRA